MNKKINFWELVLMNISAIYAIRWLPKSTALSFGLGLGAVPVWIIAAFIFFLPTALIFTQLAIDYSNTGGFYEWIGLAYGKKYGFLVCWLYWLSMVFYFASYLTFLVINLFFAIGKSELTQNKFYIAIISVLIFWLISLIATKGITFGKFFASIGALGSSIPTVIILSLAFFGVLTHRHIIPTDYKFKNFMPKLNFDSFVAISSIMFALSGSETTANFVNQIENPKKNFRRASIISAIIISCLYSLGAFSLTLILNPKDITASRGLLDCVFAIFDSLKINHWFARLIALGISLAAFGAILLYASSSVKMLFASTEKKILPDYFTRLNKHGVAQNALIFQAVFIMLIIIFTNLFPGVDEIYNILVTMTSLTGMLPYVLLYLSFIKLYKRKNKILVFMSYITLLIVLLGIILSTAPVMKNLHENILYELEIIGGPVLFILAGLLIWRRHEKI